MNNTLNDDVRDYLETDQILEPMQESSNEIQEDGATVQDGEQKKKEEVEQHATIKMESDSVDNTEQNGSTPIPSEGSVDKEDDDLQKQVQAAVSSFFKRKVELHNDQIKTFKAILKNFKKVTQKMIYNEMMILERDKKIDKPANPQDLSKGFRIPPKGYGLGFKTRACCDGDSIKFKINGVIGREDLVPFINLTVVIKGVKTNKDLVQCASCMRESGFEQGVERMNESLDKDNKIELILLDKDGNKIEGAKLEAFKKATIPTNNPFTIRKNKEMIGKAYGFNYNESIKEEKAPTWAEKVFKRNKGYVYNKDGQLVRERAYRNIDSNAGTIMA